jgi:hypothetical protein
LLHHAQEKGMNDDLAAFLRSRLDEDEQIARAVQDGSAPWDGQWVADPPHALRTRNGHVLAFSTWTTDGRNLPIDLKPGTVNHWARHDPARVLAEVDAKRRIIKAHPWRREPDWPSGRQCRQCATEHPCNTLRLLALPEAGHPDYRPEWAPVA